MTRKFLQLAMVAAGLALTVGSVSACSDDSTATAPITSNPVTTTSMYSTTPSSSAAPSTTASAEETADSDAPDEPAPQEPGGTALPATAPEPGTGVPQSFPGPDGQEIGPKGKAYLAALKADNVTFMGDTDNSVALTMAEYVCNERKKGTDPVTVKAFVTASVGPGTDTVVEANTKADKVIKAADENYC
ncbi:DUF732 domain-containing protein [Gordonia sp. Z-3]|jgi:hypothetical protein|uniref:DUF732 domain-containing protein n=2 Tax=Gordonia TaxID=2053 RepID=A0A9X3D7U4_9ACTN|nr:MULTISPECIES: DUF732 domain-containing protein [Gordonia]MAU83780.1 DUF732 domain-containing protein [Gordonia sp. (in: high G+C Gram-positive bacteria)]MCF3938571.1 DUF732 domain-containing protein [Gordonia tangerina]MCX2966770.1 DUF732 domain-containing protein [Gordonia aquimaris]MED5803209.1 DUF732 domain-containing protein [Gordonia sp. Z-3]